MCEEDYEDDVLEEDYEDDVLEDNFDMQFGECYFPGECCMPGPHYPMECFTAEMAMEEQRYYEMIEREELELLLQDKRSEEFAERMGV